MSSRKEAFNPFYGLLVVLGIAFAVTACAYGLLTLRGLRGIDLSTNLEPTSLMGFLHHHGGATLAVELVLLALATFSAMATDDYWQRRHREANGSKSLFDSSTDD